MKDCDDCGASSPDGAVTCVECGSLFVDQVGIELSRPPAVREDEKRPFSDIAELTSSGAVARAVSQCRQCGATGLASQRRCAVCGSAHLSLQLAAPTVTPNAVGPQQTRMSAWDRRPAVGVFDEPGAEITSEFAYVYFAIGLFKMLLGSMLAGTLIFGSIGTGGLQYMTFVWRYPLAAVLFLDAFLAALGGFGLIRARRSGAWMLAVSFVLDVLLLGWLVFGITTNRLVVWPASGPYVVLGMICLYCLYDTLLRTRRGGVDAR